MRIICFILFLLPVFCLGQTSDHIESIISIGQKKTIHSAILDEDREVWIYVPSTAGADSTTRYPVVYLLDGSDFFHMLTGIVTELGGIGRMPKMIVVGIMSKDRGSDFTPSNSKLSRDGMIDSDFKNSGRGDKFISFIEKELMPYVNTNHKTQPYNLFAGHSLGGLSVLHALVNHPNLFSAYVAIDPSVWWDKHMIVKQAREAFTQKDYTGKTLYYATSNTMAKGMDTVLVIQDTAYVNGNVRNHFQFRDVLRESKKLQWAWKFYPDDNHSSVPLISLYDALRFIFKDYELGKDLNDATITEKYIKDHYNAVSRMLQYTVLPPEGTVNLLGYIAMGNKQYDNALSFFTMNIVNYPESPNAYDSIGDYYAERKEHKKAVEAFKRALLLNEAPETREKLEWLQADTKISR